MKIFIVIPLYNEARHIGHVLKTISKYKLETVVVDDGSTDTGPKIVNRYGVHLLSHKVNLGKGAAMKTGAEFAFEKGAGAVIFMDSDGQHLATDLPKFVKAINAYRYDLVFGSRNLNLGVPLVRYLGNKIASVICAFLFGPYISDSICGFRAITRMGYKKIKWNATGYGVEIEMIARAGKNGVRYIEVPVEVVYINDVKGVTILDAFGILAEVVKLKLTI